MLLDTTPGQHGFSFDLKRIGAGLAFEPSLAPLLDALKSKGAAVVQAPPGSGKTTLVPPAVANAFKASAARRVIVTQPRRVAARSAAARLAALSNSELGHFVSYSVRGDHRSGRSTVVEFVTPGILLRRLLSDPGLDGVAAVVLDEVHERSLESDLLVGMLSQVHELREDLVLVAMSATLEAHRFASLLGGGQPVPVIDSPHSLFPLEIIWAPSTGLRLDERGVSRAFLDHMVRTSATAHAASLLRDPSTDALVFAPGAREVSYIAARLRSSLGHKTDVIELHGQVNPREQDAAISGRRPGGRPRIVVSTSLAESSLTVPGVRLVIDSGLAREPRRDSARGISGLVTVSCSQAAAVQRGGRAARLGPGQVIRCYDQRSFAAAPAHPTPEIMVSELSNAALVLACWGTPGGEGIELPDNAPAAAMEAATALLLGLGALEKNDAGTHLPRVTPLGRLLADMPLEPRVARALVDGAAAVGADSAAEGVALMAQDTRVPNADLAAQLSAFRNGNAQGAGNWRSESTRLAKLVKNVVPTHARLTSSSHGASSSQGFATGGPLSAQEKVAMVVALAFPERIARRVGPGPSYLLASGTRAALPPGSPLLGSEWLAVSELNRESGRATDGTGAIIRAAVAFDMQSAKRIAAPLLSSTVVAHFDGQKVAAEQTHRLGAIILSTTPVKANKDQAREAIAVSLRESGLDILPFTPAAIGLRRRLAFLHRQLGEPWPDVSDAELLEYLDDWFAPELDALAVGKPASSLNLETALSRLLPWPAAAQLDTLAPLRLSVPSGSRIALRYPDLVKGVPVSERAVVAVKLQECFGLAQTPTVAGGRSKVLFHLLSPAGHPLAVTDDLPSFWAGPYAQVRAQMRGKYPKHPWPEDPWSMPATAKVKRLM